MTLLTITVVPSSGKQTCILDAQGALKCYLKSQPEKGKANKELITFLAKKLSLPTSAFFIKSGLTSRKKRIEVDTQLSYAEILARLGLAYQHSID